jgi:hypothetical protein
MGESAYEITIPYFTWDHMVSRFLEKIDSWAAFQLNSVQSFKKFLGLLLGDLDTIQLPEN